MGDLEIKLKQLIIDKYGSLNKFAEQIGMSWTTLDSILKRGVTNANITNILKITKQLKIDTEQLAAGKIVDSYEPETIAAHHDDENWTEEELNEIEEFKKYVKSKRR